MIWVRVLEPRGKSPWLACPDAYAGAQQRVTEQLGRRGGAAIPWLMTPPSLESALHTSAGYIRDRMQPPQVGTRRHEGTPLCTSLCNPRDIGSTGSGFMAAELCRLQKQPTLTLSRSDSFTTVGVESRQILTERLTVTETQRDHIHDSIRRLLERMKLQELRNQKTIRILEKKYQRLLVREKGKGVETDDIGAVPADWKVLQRTQRALAATVSGNSPEAISVNHADYVVANKTLSARVIELEKVVAHTNDELRLVILKLNMAQVEVAERQEERDTAAREVRRLQKKFQDPGNCPLERRAFEEKGA